MVEPERNWRLFAIYVTLYYRENEEVCNLIEELVDLKRLAWLLVDYLNEIAHELEKFEGKPSW